MRQIVLLLCFVFVPLIAQAQISGTVTVSADANDDDGDVNTADSGVATMTWLFEGVFVFDTPPPTPGVLQHTGSFPWDTTQYPNGVGNLTAEACDVAGNCATSAPVAVDVLNESPDTTPPTIVITSPQ